MEEKKNRAPENEREETASALSRLQCCPHPTGFLSTQLFFPPLPFSFPPLYRFHSCRSPRTQTPTIWDALARPPNYPSASGENNGTPTPFACVTLSYSIPEDAPLGGAHITCRAGPLLQRSHLAFPRCWTFWNRPQRSHKGPQSGSGPLMSPWNTPRPRNPPTERLKSYSSDHRSPSQEPKSRVSSRVRGWKIM